MGNKRFLITTGLAETRPNHSLQEVLFLGEWCRKYEHRGIWSNYSSKILKYHWDDRNKLYEDYQDLQILYERVLVDLAEKLNLIHDTQHTLMYWRIFIGPWLNLFIGVLYDRYSSIRSAFENKNSYNMLAISQSPLNFVPNDMREFQNMIVTDEWNEALYLDLIRLNWTDQVEIKWISKTNQSTKTKRKNNFIKEYFKRNILPKLNKVLTKENDVFFIDSYLPLKTQFKLQRRLGQMPTMWKSENVPATKPQQEARTWHLETSRANCFESILRKMISKHIPTTYLEGYVGLNKLSSELYWPKHPRSIFTSNSFFADDLFKVWAADKKDKGCQLVIGQHGGHIGTSQFSFHEDHQISIADKYISWGWTLNGKKNIYPVGNLKCLGLNVSYNSKGGAILVELSLPRYSYHMMAIPIAGQYLEYLDDQKKFLSKLSPHLRKQVTVRLGRPDYDWKVQDRWAEAMSEVFLDRGKRDIKNAISRSRLYISTYNATTFLESLAWNVPTIIFWNKNHWELRNDNQPYFELLEKCGIFHGTPESAAQQMVDIWDDVDSWWHSKDVQKARQVFIDQYSKVPKNSLELMEEVLL